MNLIGTDAIHPLFRDARTASSFLDRTAPAEVLASAQPLPDRNRRLAFDEACQLL